MHSYKLIKESDGISYAAIEIIGVVNPTYIGMDINNTDARRFVGAWIAGASVVDEMGNPVVFDPPNIALLRLTGILPVPPDEN